MRHYRYDEFMDNLSFPFRAFRTQVPQTILAHTHDFIELVFIEKGSGRHEISGVIGDINEGDVYLVEPGTNHGYHIADHYPVTLCNVIFDASIIQRELEVLYENDPFFNFFYVEPFLNKRKPLQPHLNVQRSDRIKLQQMIESLIEEDQKRELGYQMFIKTALIQLLIFLSRYYDKTNRAVSITLNNEQEMMRSICEFIAAHRTQPLSLEQVSRLCGLGTTSFSTKFKSFTGCTFIEYRNRLRVKLACEDLASTNNKILDIAMNAGFEDLSHFNKVFRSELCMSPKEYRNRSSSIGEF